MLNLLSGKLLGGHKPSPRRSRAGFTLIELLVVIAVIAIIAAILFPAFASARERARQTVCISNMRQISMAMLEYADDFDDRCPLFFAGAHVTPGSRVPGVSGPWTAPYEYWTELVAPYVQRQGSHDFNTASKVFVCPSAPYNASVISAHRISNVSSYGLTDNWAEWYCPNDCNNGTGQSHSFAEAVAPGSTILIAETLNNNAGYPGLSIAFTPIDGGDTGYSYATCDSAHEPAFSPARMFNDLSWRHTQPKRAWCADPPPSARINVAYADGHATSKTLAALSDFRQWSIFQGHGDVGCTKNVDGTYGCWYP